MVSLTSMIKGKANRDIDFQKIMRNVIPKREKFYTLSQHDAFSSQYVIQAPYQLSNTYYSSIIGTAFDYLARLIIAKKVSWAKDEVWIDSASERGLKMLVRITPDIVGKKLFRKYNKGLSLAKQFVRGTTEITTDLLNHSTYMARLEHVMRSGLAPESIKDSLLSEEEFQVITELGRICDVFQNEFMIPEIITIESDVVFNPHFGISSIASGSADADIFIDGVLYDFKTTKIIGYRWQDIAQVFGYYFLHEISNRGNDVQSMLQGKKITSLALYKARYGEVEKVNISDMDLEKMNNARNEIANFLRMDIHSEYRTTHSKIKRLHDEGRKEFSLLNPFCNLFICVIVVIFILII